MAMGEICSLLLFPPNKLIPPIKPDDTSTVFFLRLFTSSFDAHTWVVIVLFAQRLLLFLEVTNIIARVFVVLDAICVQFSGQSSREHSVSCDKCRNRRIPYLCARPCRAESIVD